MRGTAPLALAGISLSPLLLLLAVACPGPPILRRTEDPWVTLKAPGDLQYLYARRKASWYDAHLGCHEHDAFLLIPPNSGALSYGHTGYHLMTEELREIMPLRTSAAMWVDVRYTNDSWKNSDGTKLANNDVWAMLPVQTSGERERCGFLYVFPKDFLSPEPNITLAGLLDGNCNDRREFICTINITTK